MVWTLLVVAWAVVLVPAFLRHRAERGGDNSIVAFRERLSVIHATGAPMVNSPVGASRARRARKRRRDIFTGLLVAAVLSLGLSFLPGLRVVLMLHLALDVLLGIYILLLLRWKAGALGRRSVAAYRFEEPADLRLAYADDGYATPYATSAPRRR